LTARGLGIKEFKEIAEVIHDILQNPLDTKLKKEVKNKIKSLFK